MQRIYLDHAATSHPKPPEVVGAVRRWFTELGVSADRGDSALCTEVANVVDGVRHRLGEMCGVPAHRVLFTSGATESLNVFLAGFLANGDAYLTTTLEHSSLIRPLTHLGERRQLEGTRLSPDPQGYVAPEKFADALAFGKPARLVAFSHASNVIGSVLEAKAICAIARDHGATTLLDASATAGLLCLDVGADVVIGSAHKSLLAPPGLGFLAVREGIEIRPTRFGGTGSSRALDRQPDTWPAAMESGTPNTPAIFGLAAALDFIAAEGRDNLLRQELERIDEAHSLLEGIATTYGPEARSTRPRIPVLSFNVDSYDPAEVGMILDAAGIHVRTGFHCAPLLHDDIGTADHGTVRVSAGPFTSADDIRAFGAALPRA